MRNRWGVLTILFVVRLTMALQFQSVAAVAPLLETTFGVSLADIGILIGLYFTPGVALALPGGAVGKRFGDKTTTIGALVVMMVGSLIMAFAEAWGLQMAGRLLAGAGGVLLNVQLTKMVTDWFAGKEIATAMGIFVNSWPAGVAISLVLLPLIGTAHGAGAAFLAVSASIVVAIGLMALYEPPAFKRAEAISAANLDRHALIAVVTAGLIWGLFNVGFAMILSFGPTLLVERGFNIAAAGSIVSLVLWLSTLSVPLGGFLADRTKYATAVLVGGCLIVALLMAVLARSNAVFAAVIGPVVGLGLISGLPAGPMMSLPTRVLRPPTRAIGMGIFYTVYYAVMTLGPAIAGRLAKSTGSAAIALDLGAAAMMGCIALVWLFERMAAAHAQPV